MQRELPEGWEEANLLKYIGIVKPGVKEYSGYKKYISTGSLQAGVIADFVEVNYDDKPSRANMEVRKDDVLFAKMMDTEKTFLVKEIDENNLYSTGFSVLRIKNKNKIIPIYLYYWIRSYYFQSKKNSLCTGATQKAINNSKLKNFTIIVPPVETQHEIVSLLEKAEETKRLREQADELTQQILENIFLDTFGDPRFMDKLTLPQRKLGDITKIIVPTRDKPKKFTGNIPWVTPPDLTNSIYVADSKFKLSKEEAKPTKCRLFPKKTVILSCAGSLGKVAISKKEIYTNQQFYGLVCNESKISPEYLAFHLRLLGEDFYKRISGTSTLAFFKKKSASNIKIMLPEISKQQNFSEIVKAIDKMKESQRISSQEIDTLFNALMQKAFTGKL